LDRKETDGGPDGLDGVTGGVQSGGPSLTHEDASAFIHIITALKGLKQQVVNALDRSALFLTPDQLVSHASLPKSSPYCLASRDSTPGEHPTDLAHCEAFL
jgi:hypothetical protein